MFWGVQPIFWEVNRDWAYDGLLWYAFWRTGPWPLPESHPRDWELWRSPEIRKRRRGEREREREREREERRLRSSLMQWSVSWKRERERKIKFTNSAGLILTSKNIDSIIFRNFQAKQLILGWESILLFEQGIDFFQMNHGSQFAIFGIDTALFLNCNWPRFIGGQFLRNIEPLNVSILRNVLILKPDTDGARR